MYAAVDSAVSRLTVKKRTSRAGNRAAAGVRPGGMAISSVMTTRSRRWAAPALLAISLLAISLLVGACGNAAPSAGPATPAPSASPGATAAAQSPSASPSSSATAAAAVDDAALYAEIEDQVIQLRGLQPKTPVARNVIDQAGVRDLMTRKYQEETPAALVKAAETLYKELLLMPQDASLDDLFVDLYSSSAAGLYDDDTKQLYVISDASAIGPVEKATYAHEYTHALQDQVYGLKAVIGDATDQSDRSIARTAQVEGDAYLTMGLWAQANLTAAELGQIATTKYPEAEAALARLPEIVKQGLMFPATTGIGLALADYAQGGFAAIDKRFSSPPDSTEQILHADKLAAGEKPVVVAIPEDLASRLGAGWTVPIQDTMGEMQLEILLREGGATKSKDAAAGWGGDRVALVEGPDGAVGVVLDTAWDTEADAAEYAAALEPLVAKLKAAGRSAAVLVPEPGRVVLVSGSSDDVLGRVANVLGLAQ